MNKENQEQKKEEEFAGWGSIQPFPWAKDLPEVTGR